MTEIQQRAQQAELFPLGPFPTDNVTTKQCGLPHLGEHLRLRLYYVTGVSRQKKKKIAQRKEQIKAPEKIQLRDEEIANLSDAELKTLVIRMLTEMIE